MADWTPFYCYALMNTCNITGRNLSSLTSEHLSAKSGLMPGLQALRFGAALGIFVYHIVIYAQRSNVIPEGYIFTKYGGVGVAVFFVLSGFLMGMLSENTTPAKFILRRALRIYPGLWLAVLTAIALKYFVLGEAYLGINWVAALSLIPSGPMRYPLNVEWTLVFEMFFYCLVAVLCILPLPLRKITVALWLVAILTVGEPRQAGNLVEIALSHHNLPFIIGMFTWWMKDELPFIKGPLPVLAGIGLLILARENSSAIGGWTVYYVGASIAASLWVLAAARATLFSESGIFKTLGDSSYGIYLIHAPLMFTVFPLIGQPTIIGFWIAFAGILVAATAFGLLEHRLHLLVRRLMSGFKLKGLRKPTSAVATRP